MSYNPPTLRDLGAYWTSQGGVNLGVVGDADHTVGYHLGKDRIYDGAGPGLGDQDYSVRQARDKTGLSDAASAIDLGRLNGSLERLYDFTNWLVERCQSGAPGTSDVREIVYSPDGKRVQRWSGVDNEIHIGPGNGDASHIGHSHISFYRDSEKRDKTGLFVPFFEEEVMGPDWYILGPVAGQVTIAPNRGLVNLVTGEAVVPPQDGRTFTTSARGALRQPFGGTGGDERRRGFVVNYGPKGEAVAHLLLEDAQEGDLVPAPSPAPGPHTHTVVTTIDGVQVEPQGSVTLP